MVRLVASSATPQNIVSGMEIIIQTSAGSFKLIYMTVTPFSNFYKFILSIILVIFSLSQRNVLLNI